MERKQILNQLKQRFNKVVQNPVNAVCLDNPDSLLVSDHGLVGVFLPTTEEYKNTDHLLRRLWLSRMVYSGQMMPLVIIDGEKLEELNLDVLGNSFGNMMPYESIDDTVNFINRRVDNVKGLSQKVRQDAFLNYYYIMEYLRSREVKPMEQLDDAWLYGESIPVRSWSRDMNTYIRNTVVDDNQNQIVFRKKNTQSFRDAMNSVLTYSMLRKYDYNRHSLYLNRWDDDQFLSVNTDYDIWNDSSSYSGLYLRTLAFYGILPMNVGYEEEYNIERSMYVDFIHSKRNNNG